MREPSRRRLRRARIYVPFFSDFSAAAEAGDAHAQYGLAHCLQHGLGVATDPIRAAQWYEKAAAQGYAPAQHALGAMYASGEGVSADAARAAECYKQAAEQGYAPAMYALGEMRLQGLGVDLDTAEGQRLQAMALQLGFTPGQMFAPTGVTRGVGPMPLSEKEMMKVVIEREKAAEAEAQAAGVLREKERIALEEAKAMAEQAELDAKMAREEAQKALDLATAVAETVATTENDPAPSELASQAEATSTPTAPADEAEKAEESPVPPPAPLIRKSLSGMRELGRIVAHISAASIAIGWWRSDKYKVKDGDTVFSLTKDGIMATPGDPKYEKMLHRNPVLRSRLGTVDLIYPGEVLSIPRSMRRTVKTRRRWVSGVLGGGGGV